MKSAEVLNFDIKKTSNINVTEDKGFMVGKRFNIFEQNC
jgi:hypothetical protein